MGINLEGDKTLLVLISQHARGACIHLGPKIIAKIRYFLHSFRCFWRRNSGTCLKALRFLVGPCFVFFRHSGNC